MTFHPVSTSPTLVDYERMNGGHYSGSRTSYPTRPTTYSRLRLLKEREIQSTKRMPSSFSHIAFSPMALRSFTTSKATITHDGCINTAKWNSTGDFLYTGSDDRTVKIWSLTSSVDKVKLKQTIKTLHRGNIFCIDFTSDYPDRIVTAAADGSIRTNYLHSNNTGETLHTSDDMM